MKNNFINRNATTILTCLGGAGVVATAITTAKATIKAHDILEEAAAVKGEDLTNWEKVQIAAPSYVAPVIIAATTIGCVFSAHLLNKKKQASLLGAYALLDQTYQQYRHKVEDLYGNGTDVSIRTEIAAERASNKRGELELFYDVSSDRYFESTRTDVLLAQSEVNRMLVTQDYLYLNDWYQMIGLERLDRLDDCGWTTGMCMATYWQTWIDFGHRKATNEEGREYTAIYFYQEPMEGFETYDY